MRKPAKKISRSKLIKKLDIIFSKYIRVKNADKHGFCTCVTCKKKFHWKSIQAGHFMSRKHYSTRWNENNVHPQCVGCNMFKQGEQYKYSVFLGPELAEKLYLQSTKLVKFTNHEINSMITDYQEKLNRLL